MATKPTTDDDFIADKTPATLSLYARMSIAVRHWISMRSFTLGSSLIALVLCLVLGGLGTWQIARLHQKNAQIEHIQNQLHATERDLRLNIPINNDVWRGLDYRRVVVQGQWLSLHPLKMQPRTYEGQSGYHLMMPLLLKNGQILIVNRGWVPDKVDVGLQDVDTVTLVAGVVREAPTEKPFGMLDNNPARDFWAWPDMTAIANRIGTPLPVPVILYAERAQDAQADEYPIGGQIQVNIRNEHKHYAMTWYSLGIALLVIWLMAARKPAPKKPAAPVATAAE